MRRAPGLVIATGLAFILACQAAAPAVVLPDLSSLAKSVQRQIRERDESLRRMLGDPNTPPAAPA